jgi:hypothetical protein
MNNASTVRKPSGRKATSVRRFGRIPTLLRAESIRRMSGRAWKGLEATDQQTAAALGIERRNAAKRRAGESGPFAGACVEVYRLAAANIDPYPLIAHQKSLAIMATLRETPTEDLEAELVELHERETEANGALDVDQLRHAAGKERSLLALRDHAAAQAAVSERMVAICEELIARQG